MAQHEIGLCVELCGREPGDLLAGRAHVLEDPITHHAEAVDHVARALRQKTELLLALPSLVLSCHPLAHVVAVHDDAANRRIVDVVGHEDVELVPAAVGRQQTDLGADRLVGWCEDFHERGMCDLEVCWMDELECVASEQRTDCVPEDLIRRRKQQLPCRVDDEDEVGRVLDESPHVRLALPERLVCRQLFGDVASDRDEARNRRIVAHVGQDGLDVAPRAVVMADAIHVSRKRSARLELLEALALSSVRRRRERVRTHWYRGARRVRTRGSRVPTG